jgi:hypothetical protein
MLPMGIRTNPSVCVSGDGCTFPLNPALMGARRPPWQEGRRPKPIALRLAASERLAEGLEQLAIFAPDHVRQCARTALARPDSVRL